MAYLAIGARALLTVVFLVSASSKLRSGAAYADFAASVRAFRLLPERAVGPVAALVTAVECCVPVLVWRPPWRARCSPSCSWLFLPPRCGWSSAAVPAPSAGASGRQDSR
jgi:hypothetical protein